MSFRFDNQQLLDLFQILLCAQWVIYNDFSRFPIFVACRMNSERIASAWRNNLIIKALFLGQQCAQQTLNNSSVILIIWNQIIENPLVLNIV